MDKYFVADCTIGGEHYHFCTFAKDLEEAEHKVAQSAYNFYNFRLADTDGYCIKEVSEEV